MYRDASEFCISLSLLHIKESQIITTKDTKWAIGRALRTRELLMIIKSRSTSSVRAVNLADVSWIFLDVSWMFLDLQFQSPFTDRSDEKCVRVPVWVQS